MKKFFVVLFLSACLGAQAADSQWTTSVPKALTKAQKEHKLVLLDFTGSDWCIPCHRMEVEIFSQPEFLNYAKKSLVLVTVDFPLKKRLPDALQDANDALQTKYDIRGYPTLVVLNPAGTVVWTTNRLIKGGPQALIEDLEKLPKS